ncbi:hypothetical protein EDD18DRAFT_1110532 [Armillaria luteobubalina]|uniref:Zn(2)-C6 fungal-type domain-containing protein n=1 Tax=Armillaria luteobubalina TaxID=153913 RepID=A0AA39PPM4_9AGAR|nr:hypothetical protein EDD18DRAFT_1110532 [Armillaria luteobubalina]
MCQSFRYVTCPPNPSRSFGVNELFNIGELRFVETLKDPKIHVLIAGSHLNHHSSLAKPTPSAVSIVSSFAKPISVPPVPVGSIFPTLSASGPAPFRNVMARDVSQIPLQPCLPVLGPRPPPAPPSPRPRQPRKHILCAMTARPAGYRPRHTPHAESSDSSPSSSHESTPVSSPSRGNTPGPNLHLSFTSVRADKKTKKANPPISVKNPTTVSSVLPPVDLDIPTPADKSTKVEPKYPNKVPILSSNIGDDRTVIDLTVDDDESEEAAWTNAFLDVVRRAPPIATTNLSPLPPTTKISPSFPPPVRHPSRTITAEKQVFPQEKSSTAERRTKTNERMAQPRDNEIAPSITLNTKRKALHQAGPESSKKIKISCANHLPHLSSLQDAILGMTTGFGEVVPADAIPVGYPQDSRPIGHVRVEKDYGPYIESMGAYWRKDVARLLSQFVFKNPCDNCVGAKTQCRMCRSSGACTRCAVQQLPCTIRGKAPEFMVNVDAYSHQINNLKARFDTLAGKARILSEQVIETVAAMECTMAEMSEVALQPLMILDAEVEDDLGEVKKGDEYTSTCKIRILHSLALFKSCPSQIETNQQQLIVSQFGFSTIQTTLIGCVDGIVKTSFKPIGRGDAGALMYIVAILGALLRSQTR